MASVTPLRAASVVVRRWYACLMREPTSSPSTTVIATGLNTKVALEIAAVAKVHFTWPRSSTLNGFGK
ncbi:hypothetical protein D9M72_407670 [compost metagenome]